MQRLQEVTKPPLVERGIPARNLLHGDPSSVDRDVAQSVKCEVRRERPAQVRRLHRLCRRVERSAVGHSSRGSIGSNWRRTTARAPPDLMSLKFLRSNEPGRPMKLKPCSARALLDA